MLLGLVALASRGDRPFAGESDAAREPSTAFWDYLFSVSLAVALAGFGVAIWALATRRGRDLAAEKKQTKRLIIFFVVGIAIGLLVAARFADVGWRGLRSDQRGAETGQSSTAEASEQSRPPYSPEFQWLPVVLLAGAGVATAVAFVAHRRAVRRRRTRRRMTDTDFAAELAALLDDTLDDLRAEPDSRRAVIAAYARTERALAGYGFPRRHFEAPLEYLDRIAAPLHETQPAARRLVFELTHLFERAKFSSHAIDAEMKEDAIATLAALRDELRKEAA